MVSWFAQTAKDLFRHLAFSKDNLSAMNREVFYVHLICLYSKEWMFLFTYGVFFTICVGQILVRKRGQNNTEAIFVINFAVCCKHHR